MSDVVKFESPNTRLSRGPVVLIVDDEKAGQMASQSLLEPLGDDDIQILLASSIKEARTQLRTRTVQVVLLDKNLGPDESNPEYNGIESIPEFLSMQPHLQILMLTGSNDPRDITRAMKLGATGYLLKDQAFDVKLEQVRAAVRHSIALQYKIRNERANKAGVVSIQGAPSINFVGDSPVTTQLLNRIKAVGENSWPVLLLGESGTGKSHVAKMIHGFYQAHYKLKDSPFFGLNMSNFTDELAESELFGSAKGGFTDAVDKQGFLELANNGTLFLDEIAEASPGLQAKLLKALDEKSFHRVGGGKTLIHSNFRLICATNQNLEELVSQGKFRIELLTRINTLKLEVPSLRDRADDIPAIIKYLLEKVLKESGIRLRLEDVPDSFIEYVSTAEIPGNIRGLESYIKRLAATEIKDSSGRPVLSQWRKILGINPETPARLTKAHRKHLELKELMDLPVNTESSDFPGVAAVMDAVKDNILRDIERRFSKNADRARALKLSESQTSLLYAKLNHRRQSAESPSSSSHLGAQNKTMENVL